MRRRSGNPPPPRGFALVLVLALAASIGLLTAGSLQETLFGEALAGSRLLHLRAWLLADSGMAEAMHELTNAALPRDFTRELRPIAGSAESAVVSVRQVATGVPPAGFSLGRFAAHYFIIESTGRSARGTRAVQVQGVTRVMPQVTPAAAP
ncbi:MAG: hypothetical protein ABW278_08920 [Steroidobacteraceae bacterium]